MSADMRMLPLKRVMEMGHERSNQRIAAVVLGQMTPEQHQAAIDAWVDTVRAYLAAYDTLYSHGYVDTTQEGNR